MGDQDTGKPRCAICKMFGPRMTKVMPGMSTTRSPRGYGRCQLKTVSNRGGRLRYVSDWCDQFKEKD